MKTEHRYASTSSMLLRRTGVNTDRQCCCVVQESTQIACNAAASYRSSRTNEEKVSVCVLRESQVTPHMIN